MVDASVVWSAHELAGGGWEEIEVRSGNDMRDLLRDENRAVWVDIDARAADPTDPLAELAQAPELNGLSPSRAAQGGENPPAFPPKAKTFDEFVFARMYLLKYGAESGASKVVAQEIHVIAGQTFAITIRYECVAWDPESIPTEDAPRLESARDEDGLSVQALQRDVDEFRRQYGASDASAPFGLVFIGVLMDRVIDSVFDTLNSVRLSADNLELEILHKEKWIWNKKKWPMQDKRLQGLWWLLRQIRWAFMPPDEISELSTGPFDLTSAGRRLTFLFDDLGREADRALQTVKDITDQVRQTAALRDTIKTDRLNETLYVLTAVATVLLVPTLIAGIYGMNFQHMPELEWRLGYAGAAIAMLTLGGLTWYLIRRHLRGHGPEGDE